MINSILSTENFLHSFEILVKTFARHPHATRINIVSTKYFGQSFSRLLSRELRVNSTAIHIAFYQVSKQLVRNNMKIYIFVVCWVAVLTAVSGDFTALPLQSVENFSDADDVVVKNEMIRSEQSLISKMIERGKILVKSIPKTGLKLAGRVWDFVPTPATIFNVSKQTLIGLPQELIAYAVNSVCKCFRNVCACLWFGLCALCVLYYNCFHVFRLIQAVQPSISMQ